MSHLTLLTAVKHGDDPGLPPVEQVTSREYVELHEQLAREAVRADQLHDALRPFVERPGRITEADRYLARIALSDSAIHTEMYA